MNQIFNFQNQSVRIQFQNNEPYFCLADVAKIMEIKNPRQLKLNSKGVCKAYTPTESGNQEMTFINEPNLYRVIFRSNKPEAVKFQDWIFEEVIPQIRQTGSYTIKITPAQKQQIQSAVNRRVHRTGDTHQNIYRTIHELANVASYHDIAAADFDKVMTYLDGQTAPVPTKPISQDLFRHLAKMAMYAGHWANFQRLMCQNPNSEQARHILNEVAYSTSSNQTGFLFIFKPDVENDIKQAVDWLHAQSSHYALAE